MHSAFLLSLFVMTMTGGPGDDNGAYPWGDGWVVYGKHGVDHGGIPARKGGRHADASPWSGCHSIPGPNEIRYVQCDKGPGAQNDLFEGVVPGDPVSPAVTPEILLQEALRQLRPPVPVVNTAPPRGREGLVGLRHFFWAGRGQWHAISKRVVAGPVWAEVTATPNRLVIKPGAGQPSVACQGPGTPYSLSKRPEGQKSDCSYLFTRSSAGLPGSRYRVTVSVVWTAAWTGSGGTGGTLAPITTSITFPLRVAEGQALIQRSS